MTETDSNKRQSKYKQWLINIVILIIVTVVMLMLVEGVTRVIDGYQLSTIDLNQDTRALPPSE